MEVDVSGSDSRLAHIGDLQHLGFLSAVVGPVHAHHSALDSINPSLAPCVMISSALRVLQGCYGSTTVFKLARPASKSLPTMRSMFMKMQITFAR